MKTRYQAIGKNKKVLADVEADNLIDAERKLTSELLQAGTFAVWVENECKVVVV